MSKGQCNFRKSDVKRAFEAAQMADAKVARIEIDKAGKIILVLNNDATAIAPVNEWDTAAE